jgi:hypothetical protein
MIEIKEPAKVKMKIFGTEYDIQLPTMKEVKELGEQAKARAKGESEKSALDSEVEFVVKAGIPMDVIEKLPPSSYRQVVDFLFADLKG